MSQGLLLSSAASLARLSILLGVAGVGACGCSDAPDTRSTVAVGPAPNASAYAVARARLEEGTPQDPSALLARWQPSYLDKLPYDPAQAVNLPLIQGSGLKLSSAELDTLSKNGLTISARQSFATFFMGYLSIYANDLPLFVSGDSVLHAVHRSYDAILKEVEEGRLVAGLNALVTGMRSALAAEGTTGTWPADTVVDVDQYLTVALSLAMASGSAAPVAGADPRIIEALVSKARAAEGAKSVAMFGEDRPVDFSQFTPRGHYAGSPILEPYFRAMMWLGRMDLRLLSQKATGEVLFSRRQFAAAALMAKLVEPVKKEWETHDRTMRAFVGESDNMTPADFAALLANLGVDSWKAALDKSDAELASAIVAGGFGIQRIASQLLFVHPGNEGAPLDRAFLLLGQRFIIDSQVLSNVVFDRVKEAPRRMMPNPLDVAFAALGNAGALDFLIPDLQAHPGYPQALHQARVLVDEHEPDYFSASLYTSWVGALRAVSPTWTAGGAAPPIVGTRAWNKRVLQMQLASWAELRHDNVLYAKPSYTAMPVCDFPDAYVEPIPALWHAIAELANRGSALVTDLGLQLGSSPGPGAYFASLASTAGMLEAMATEQEQGQPFTEEQMAFINEAVEQKTESTMCGAPKRALGWYPKLFYQQENVNKQDTLVVDVHTQPSDEGGNMVGKVLHAGTGFPRLMVVTFSTCSGPRAYAGVVSAYHETTTENFDRLTDQRWTNQIASAVPAELPWISDLVNK